MKAYVIQERGKAAVAEASKPELRDDYVLVKVENIGLNPTDWKHIDFLASPGAIVGCDYSGVVEAVGKNVSASSVKPGDRIGGVTHGSNTSSHGDGCFGEYAVGKDGLFAKVPESWSLAEAATLGVGVTTVGQALYQSLQLPWPDKPASEPFPILIYGGSTATGLHAIQFAKLSGLEVYATSSPHNFDLLKSYGADHLFDYRDKDCGSQIREKSGNKLRYVFDTVSEGNSKDISAAALSSDSSQPLYHTSLLGAVKDFPRDNVNVSATLAYTAIGERFEKGGRVTEARPEDLAFIQKFWVATEKLLQEKKLKPIPTEVREGGLAGVTEGLQDLKNGRVSGKKLVYKVSQ